MRAILASLLCTAAFAASAQGSDDNGEAASSKPAEGAKVAELDTIRVTAPRTPVDPFAFRNPIEVEHNRFDRDWRDPVSAESIGMQGGLVQMGINYALMKAAEGVKTLPGWKDQIQHASARPPPLDQTLIERAARLQESSDGIDDER